MAVVAPAPAAQEPTLSADERAVIRRVSVRSIRKTTTALAHDRLEGRGTLQPGGEKAAAWLADHMKQLGLQPGGTDGSYYQPVPLQALEFAPPTHVSVDGVPLKYGTDWSALGAFADLRLRAPVVFVGHGMVSRRFGRDDLKDVDLTGKIVVCIQGRPEPETEAHWAEVSQDAKLEETLFARGAAGLISVPNGREPLPRPFIINQTARRWVVSAGTEPSRVPVLFLGDEATTRLFAGAGVTSAQAMAEAARADFRPRPLPAQLEIEFKSLRTTGTSPNVIGVLRGSDPTAASEAVVFTAHYDAFGILRGRTYNGAADNAIGVAEMLAVAEAFRRSGVRPRRSLVFIAFTAEEYGLLGSAHFVANPTWDLTRVAAVLNLDGIGTEIMGPMKSMVAYGAPYSSLGAMFVEVARLYGITPMEDPIPEQGVFSRSDHYSFVTRGVPGLMLVGSPVEAAEPFRARFDAFETTRYHQPSDDVYRDWYWKGAQQVADMMALLGFRVAQADQLPAFTPGTEYAGRVRGQALAGRSSP